MKQILYYVLVLAVTTVSLSAQVTDYIGRVDTKRNFAPTPIAVEAFTGFDGSRLLVSDSMTLVRMAEVIRHDLNFSPFYEVIERDTFYMKHMELEIMTLLGWNHLGADYVVKGEGEFTGDDVTFKYRLIAAKSGLEFGRGKIKSSASNYRHLGHRVANEIIYYLTGETGIFSTRVCFISRRTGNKEVFICDYDGANIYQLTGNGSINLSPSFSADNGKILFTSFMNDDPQMFQYDLRSGSVDRLAAYPGINSAASVSPDGKYIVCSLSRDGNSELYLLTREGKIKRRLTRTYFLESGPCWSPTGAEICFSADRTGSPQIYIMDKDGINLRRLTFSGSYNDSPDWSPKGDKIVYVSRVRGRFNICTIDITGTNFRVLTELGNNENPHWSPDGNHIVFSSTRSGAKEVYIMDLFGNEEKRLTTGGGNSNPNWSGYDR